MSAEPIEKRGRLKRVIFESSDDGFKVLRFEEEGGENDFTAVGTVPELAPEQTLRMTGRWDTHPRYGRQFEIEDCEPEYPTTEEGIKKYLESRMVKGIGPKLAERIVERYGRETFQVMDEEMDRLQEVSGIGSSKLGRIREQWEEHRGLRDVMVFLKSRDISTAYAMKIYRQYGADTRAVLQENPYRISRDIEGIGFKIADRIARKLGVSSSHAFRIKAGLEHVLRQASEDGHVCLPREQLLRRTGELLEAPEGELESALEALLGDERLVQEEIPGEPEPFVYRRDLYAVETTLVDRLMELKDGDLSTPESPGERMTSLRNDSEVDFNDKQLRAIRTALAEPLFLLTGGPGTGKTTTVRGILDLMDRLDRKVKLAAPTGRAAQRMQEATDRPASTIHRMLGYTPPNWFRYNEEDPLPADVVIVDEMSMVDLWLMYHLVQALRPGTQLILVGDADQLPSVGPGDVLNDLLESRLFESIHLTEIFRQARQSAIVRNAHRVNRGEMPEVSNRSGDDFFFIDCDDPEKARDTILGLVTRRLPDHFGLDPFEDIQVMAPMYRGACGVDALNEELQSRLNPGSESAGGARPIRRGDKVMQCSNNYEKGVFNGDLGRIRTLDTSNQTLTVAFQDSGEVSYEAHEREQLTLAYAVTIHKSQGSEYPAVVVPVLTQHYIMLQRNLLYTALTRARNLAVLVGSRRAIGMAVNRDQQQRRHSLLATRLRRSRSDQDPEEEQV